MGATTAQVASASLLANSPTTPAIPGTSSLDHLGENLAANDLSLRNEELSDLRRPLVGSGSRPRRNTGFGRTRRDRATPAPRTAEHADRRAGHARIFTFVMLTGTATRSSRGYGLAGPPGMPRR
ncbi:hypothetical protein ACFXKX_17200 [Streptomyces scopuliridis]|uniref:hypothetical protein n=1 Tax=Streptomyces scopuliridis TaxID=452529 RepID=UPI00368DA515